MDRFDSARSDGHGGASSETKPDRGAKGTSKPHLSLTAMRQQLTVLRREAQRHDREALAECLSLAIALSSPKRPH